MAVDARYQSNFLPLNRSKKERTEMDSSPQAAKGFLGQPAAFADDGANGNARKRRREAIGVPRAAAPPKQSDHVNFGSLAQLQMYPPALVSTALGLTTEEKQHHRRRNQSDLFVPSGSFSPLSSGELAKQIDHQRDEIEQFLLAQEEQLRRALVERQKRHYRALLSAAEESAARRLGEKDAEVERLARRQAELEDSLGHLRTESMAWQAKAMEDQATAAALNVQLQQAAAALSIQGYGDACCDGPPADDAESAYVDPDQVGRARERACRSCRWRQASVVLLPCRHLCLCEACDAAAEACLVCHSVRSGSVRVFLR